ncbi:MAG: Flp pilus assembly complex ATPase component TadA [Anaerohalosphaeraceae bacterium]|nr:Flp pilus assembly complex ATPase component TadA [Anaerohalosphaeraceae bacterium]
MPAVTAVIEPGSYASAVKLITFFLLLLAWPPLVSWINLDSKRLRTKTREWTAATFLAGLVAFFIWILIPLFLIGMSFYIITIGTIALLYVMHRNGLVDEYEKVLTADHIKSLFTNEEKQAQKISKGLVFITANKNQVPAPLPKTPEFFGYKTAQEFFDDAIWKRVSTIALTPSGQEYNVQYVIDGVVEKQDPMEKEDVDYFIRYLKNLSDLSIKERRKPQIGRFTVQRDGKPFKWEVMTAGTTAGEQVRLKLTAEYSVMKISDIGLMNEQQQAISGIKEAQKKGVFIVSGPQKSGLTSTLYAMLRHHDPFMNNINTLEKQPAGELPNITQNVFSLSDTGTTTYSKRFQTMLRTGPDIIGVEHCQEADLARLACQAAKDNKITYVTFESQSVMETVSKWIKLVGDKNTAFETMSGISNQRLVRMLCQECKEAYEPNKELLRKFNIPAEKIKLFYRPGQVQYDKHGKPVVCEHCQGTGFYGRTGVFETIVIDDAVREALAKAKTMNEIVNIFRKAKMLYIQEQAIRKIAEGITSINEVVRVLSVPKSNVKKPVKKKE